MRETQRWIEQACQDLKSGRWSDLGSPAALLQKHLTQIDTDRVRADLGCGEECSACSWGTLGGYDLPGETCKWLILQRTVEALNGPLAQRLPPRKEAASLLELLDNLPLARTSEDIG